MKIDLHPPQSEPIERVIEQMLALRERPEGDRWWRAGLAEALGEPDEREPSA